MLVRSLAVLLFLVLVAAPAHAAFHLMKIVDVYAGSATNPTSQAVVLQMYSSGQNFLNGHSIQVYNASGVLVGTYTFPANVSNGANQAKILIATTAFQVEFGLTSDLTMSTATIDPSGGKICFDSIDCMTWGNYSGSGPVGTPAAAAGIPSGQSLGRRLDVFGAPGVLENGDDTNDSANDFVAGHPAPRNNAGRGCGDGGLDPMEQCDDGNYVDMDGCTRCGPDPAGVGDELLTGSGLRAAPNPFTGDVALQFTLSQAADVEIAIYDLVGRRIREFRAPLVAGSNRVTWDGRDNAGREARAGLYVVRARSEAFETTTRVLRLR